MTATRAVILAGGLGQRLRPLVADRPKPLALIDGEPFLARQLRHLRRFGVERFVLCVGYRAQMVIETIGDGADLGVEIEYAVEQEALGTAGALKNAEALLRADGIGDDDLFLALNGDTFVEVALDELLARQRAEPEALATICVQRVDDGAGKGVVTLDETGRWLRGFDEKAVAGEPALINAGIYAMRRALLARIPDGRAVSLERETIPALLGAGVKLAAFETRGQMLDIGTPADYERAQQALAHVGEGGPDRSGEGAG